MNLNALARHIATQEQRILTLERALEAVAGQQYDAPGYKHPYFGVVNMAIATNRDTVSGNFAIDPSGPYTLVGLHAAWRETTQAKFRPISRVMEADDASPEVNALDFEWELEIGGVNYKLQSDGIPSSFLFGNVDRPYYLPAPITLKGNAVLKVKITPIADPNAAGTLYFVFIGYKTYDRKSLAPSIESLPATKLPYIGVIDVPAPASTADQQATLRNGQDGALVVTSIGGAYRATTQTTTGTGYRPVSSIMDNLVASPVVNGTDFLWRVRTTGNDLNWSNDWLPSTLLFSNRERPLYMPVPAIVSPGSDLVFDMRPIVAPGAAGTVHIGLFGFVPLVGGAL